MPPNFLTDNALSLVQISRQFHQRSSFRHLKFGKVQSERNVIKKQFVHNPTGCDPIGIPMTTL